jgi:protein-tyrosine phosphatase
MSEPYDVLVVCEGNLCRSPLAERLLQTRLADSEVQVASAGVNAVVGATMDASAAAELTRLGGDASAFVARQLTAGMATDADLVLTATRAIRGQVVAMAPKALKRTFTLLELAALLETHPWSEGGAGEEGGTAETIARASDWRGSVSGLGDDLDVPDPIGRSPQVHRAAADLVDRATRAIAAWLA